MKDRLICIVGESGSGKTTICELLEKQGYNYIESYTDRPKRYEGERGHIFISTEEVDKYKDDMIAYTYFNNYHYFATRSQYRNKGITLYIIDPKGIEVLRKKVTDADIMVIYLKTDEIIRYKRMVRSRSVESAQERIEHDRKAFEIVQCDYVIDNNGSIKNTVEKIKKIIGIEPQKDVLFIGNKVRIVQILDTEEARHLVNLVGKEGYIVGRINYRGIDRYKVLLSEKTGETVYFRRNELEVIE